MKKTPIKSESKEMIPRSADQSQHLGCKVGARRVLSTKTMPVAKIGSNKSEIELLRPFI